MARLFRWLLRIVSGALLLGLALTFLLYWFFSRSIPDYSETLQVAGISGPVEIVRDNAAVPHIFGQSDEDVYFGLGLAHAQDRLWQMTMLRRTAQGRLSELFGARTAKIDELLRRFDFYPLSVKSFAAQDDYTKAALQAYAAGVNAWLAEVNAGVERLDLFEQPVDEFLCATHRQRRDVVDRLVRVELRALAARVLERVHDVALHAQQAELEHREQAGRASADDDALGLDDVCRGLVLGHGRSSISARVSGGAEARIVAQAVAGSPWTGRSRCRNGRTPV